MKNIYLKLHTSFELIEEFFLCLIRIQRNFTDPLAIVKYRHPPPVNSLICITALYLVIARGLTDVLLCVWQESPLSGDKSHESRPSLDGDGGEETETAPEADDEVGSLLFWFISVLWIKIHLV